LGLSLEERKWREDDCMKSEQYLMLQHEARVPDMTRVQNWKAMFIHEAGPGLPDPGCGIILLESAIRDISGEARDGGWV